MKRVHVFHTVKGGVGCTTTAVGYACWLASETREPVTLVAVTNDDAKLVMYSGWQDKVNVIVYDKTFDHLTTDVAEMVGHVVIDAGYVTYATVRNDDWAKHLVVENHYLCLRQMTMNENFRKGLYDDLVVLMSEGASLTLNDCSLVARLPIFLSVKRDEKTGRAVDAGLFPRLESLQDYRPNIAELV